VYVAGSKNWGNNNGGLMFTEDGGATWYKNMKLPIWLNLRNAVEDPNDPSKMFYLFFGNGMLYGNKPTVPVP